MTKNKNRLVLQKMSTPRFTKGQEVKIPLGDGTHQYCIFIGTDCDGVTTVKTKGGRYKSVWDSNIYDVDKEDRLKNKLKKDPVLNLFFNLQKNINESK